MPQQTKAWNRSEEVGTHRHCALDCVCSHMGAWWWPPAPTIWDHWSYLVLVFKLFCPALSSFSNLSVPLCPLFQTFLFYFVLLSKQIFVLICPHFSYLLVLLFENQLWSPYFNVLLWKLLYGNIIFLYQNWNYFTSVGVNKQIYFLYYNYNGWNVICWIQKKSLTFWSFTWLSLPIYKFNDLQRPRKMQERIKTVLFINVLRSIQRLFVGDHTHYFWSSFQLGTLQRL